MFKGTESLPRSRSQKAQNRKYSNTRRQDSKGKKVMLELTIDHNLKLVTVDNSRGIAKKFHKKGNMQ